MKLPLIALASFALPSLLSAQEGRIAFSYAVQYDFELPERFRDMDIPTASNTFQLLLFKGQEALMIPVPEEQQASSAVGGSERNRRVAMMVQRMRMGSPMRANQEKLVSTYTNFDADAVSETREFMGRTFLISGDRPAYQWTLAGDQRQFMGYVVQKATTVHDGAAIEAWFTPQIPVPGGPGPYGGLPGMILVLTVDRGKTVYSATDIQLTGIGDGVIAAPTDGDMVTRDEYEGIVAEKLEELETLRGSRGDRRRPPF